MNLGNLFIYGGIFSLLSCVLSFLWDSRKLKLKYSALLADALKDGGELKGRCALLQSEKGVWEREGLSAAKMIQELREYNNELIVRSNYLAEKVYDLEEAAKTVCFEKLAHRRGFHYNHCGRNKRRVTIKEGELK